MSENSESYYDFINPKASGSEGFLSEVFGGNSPSTLARDVLQSALGDIPRFCSHCGGFCDAHIVLLRDAILKRAHELAENLVKAIDVYQMERKLEILEPETMIHKAFDVWNRLSVLYALAEPQDYMESIEETSSEEEDP